MSWLNVVLIAYALLSAIGGIEGYLSKQSMPSLIAGIGIGALIFGSVFLSRTNKLAYSGAAIVCALTLGFFVMRYMKAQAIWPALVMVIASVAVIVCLIVGHFMNKQVPTP